MDKKVATVAKESGDVESVALFQDHHVVILARSLARWTERQIAKIEDMKTKKSTSKRELNHERRATVQMILDFYPYRDVLAYDNIMAPRLREICTNPSLEAALVEAGLKDKYPKNNLPFSGSADKRPISVNGANERCASCHVLPGDRHKPNCTGGDHLLLGGRQ